LEDHLADNPSLRSQLNQAMRNAYRLALIEVERETGQSSTTFPAVSPYTYEQAIAPDFWPE
jgi:hypothetical protein